MATLWLNQGIPIKVVSERLGHAHVGITLQIYGHLLPHMQADAAVAMDAVWQPSVTSPSPGSEKHEPSSEL
jgi:integrase